MRLRDWLTGSDRSLGTVPNWNQVLAEKHAAATERILLGACGPARVVGNRRDERIVAEREIRAEEMRRRR